MLAQPFAFDIKNLDRKIKVVVDWMQSEGLIEIYDHDYSSGKCRRWKTVDLLPLLKKAWNGFKKKIEKKEEHCLKLSISFEIKKRTNHEQLTLRIEKPPD